MISQLLQLLRWECRKWIAKGARWYMKAFVEVEILIVGCSWWMKEVL
jgi:hypothetical protein